MMKTLRAISAVAVLALLFTACGPSPAEIAEQENATASVEAENAQATNTQSAASTATQVQAETQAAEATATENAIATENAEATASAEAKATTEARAQATADFRATEAAYVDSFYAAINELRRAPGQMAMENVLEAAGNVEPEFGPDSGSLVHDQTDNFVKVDCAARPLTHFVATVTFESPYTRNRGQWDFGFFFRNSSDSHYRIVIEANGPWRLAEWDEDIQYFSNVDGGLLNNIERDSDAINTLLLVVVDDEGYLTVNDEYVGELELDTYPNSAGSLCVATGLFQGSEITGESTDYDDFLAWRIRRDRIDD